MKWRRKLKILGAITVVVLLTLSLAKCDRFNHYWAKKTGKPATVCEGKVNYLQFPSGATVKYLPTGEISTCKG